MKTSLSHLPESKQAELKAIKEALIPRYAEVEMIILFGSYAKGTWVEEKYEDKGITYEYKSDYDLLIILSKNGHANADSFVQSVSVRLDELNLETPVNPIFHGIEFVNTELRDGNYFFDEIKQEGILLFTASRYALDEKQEKSPLEQQTKARIYFEGWYNSANEFFEFFEIALEKEYLNKAAFELHQATERYYGAIQLVFTGYKPKTHDIEILGKLAKALDMEFGKAFPRATVEERRRFNLLKKAYVEARYNIQFSISKSDLEYLSDRVLFLKQLTEKICNRRLESFVK